MQSYTLTNLRPSKGWSGVHLLHDNAYTHKCEAGPSYTCNLFDKCQQVSIITEISYSNSHIIFSRNTGVFCGNGTTIISSEKKVREKSRECHNHKPQPFPDTKRKRKPTKPNKHKSEKRTKRTKIMSLFPQRGNRNAKRAEKHKNKITQGKT